MTDIPIGNPGLAAGVDTEAFTQFDALLSDVPAVFAVDYTLAASQDIALYEAVGFDGSGEIVPAVEAGGVGPIQAIGISAMAITSGVGENPSISVIRGGHWNIDALVWDASYDTDAKKLAAFNGAPTPTQIVTGINKYHRKSA